MDRFLIIFLLLMLLPTRSAQLGQHTQEAHSLLKRMAEADETFEGHDVARIYTNGGQRNKRLFKRDLQSRGNAFTSEDLSSLQLHLSSGSKVSLALVPADILDADTAISYLTQNGHTKRRWDGGNCFSYGHLEDSSGKGLTAISHCNGIFGFAKTPSYDYLVYPVGAKRVKRDTEEDYDVHVMWRRAVTSSGENTTDSSSDTNSIMAADDVIPVENTTVEPVYEKVVIEMALFADEKYCERLHRAYKERVNDYMLTMVAGTQALFGNPERVGYNIQIKVKLLEYWEHNPTAYTFKESTPNNLRSFCKYTQKKYKYDIHGLHSGIRASERGLVGLAYVGGVCTSKRCFVKKTFGLEGFALLAHELGHTLGLPHQSPSNCPKNEPYYGGFMGGGKKYNFSPCMKHQLGKILRKRRSNCLFTNSSETGTPMEEIQLPNMFPGQIKSPDELCKLFAGEGYNYVPMGKSLGNPTCRWMVCYNEDETSDAFGKAKRMVAPTGFPCDRESFCVREWACKAWTEVRSVFNYEKLRDMIQIPEWSEWSTDVSNCSRSCGTGVRTRRRECIHKGYNLAPYCPGMAVKAELCNTEPCPGDPTNKGELRRVRGDEICKRFLERNVTLNLRKSKGYLSTCQNLTERDIIPPARLDDTHSRSCLLKCDRDPKHFKGTLDAFMPDGTPCYDTKRWPRELQSLNIDLRCVRGSCVEFTDCADASQSKDECGVCGGNGSRCISLSFNSSYDVQQGERRYLDTIPTGSSNIKVLMDRWMNKDVVLEVWSNDDQSIIGRTGLYPGKTYEGSDAVQHGGTQWFYRRDVAYIHAPGPTQEPVKIKAYRQEYPINLITIQYAQN